MFFLQVCPALNLSKVADRDSFFFSWHFYWQQQISLPDCSCLHECEPALHEEDDDGHDEEEEVVDLLGLLVVDVVTDLLLVLRDHRCAVEKGFNGDTIGMLIVRMKYTNIHVRYTTFTSVAYK